jgi:hypothetical protein
MKRDSIWAFVAGILLTSVALSVFVWAFFPDDFLEYAFPLYVFEVLLWLNAYRVSRKKMSNPSI